MPRSRFTLADVNEMITLYESGVSSVEIGHRKGVDHTTVLYHIGHTHKARKYKSLADRCVYGPDIPQSAMTRRERLNLPIFRMKNAVKPLSYLELVKKRLTEKVIRDERGMAVGVDKVPLNPIQFRAIVRANRSRISNFSAELPVHAAG